jgi:hypothetical protein
LKFDRYQEFILALSGMIQGRATPESQRRYADAVNSLSLIAPPKILAALRDFQNEISYINNQRSDERHDAFLDALLRRMREEINPHRSQADPMLPLRLLAPPPEGLGGPMPG